MAIIKMVALTLIGPKNEMEPIARHMVLSEDFQPLPIDVLVNDRNIRAQLTSATENPYDELLSSLTFAWENAGEIIPEPSPVTITKDFTLTCAKIAVNKYVNKLNIWKQRLNILSAEEEELKAAKVLADALGKTSFRPNDLINSNFISAHFGQINHDSYKKLLADKVDYSSFIVEKLTETKEKVWILLLTTKNNEAEISRLLKALHFTEYPLQKIAENIKSKKLIDYLNEKIKGHHNAINGLTRASQQILADNRKQFEYLYSQLYMMQRVYSICKDREEISGMFVLSGWIPEKSLEKIKQAVEHNAPTTSIIIEQTKEIPGIEIPTLLRNNKFFTAFQYIVSMYSLPSYEELDPSPIVAISFILFFGFMFGDVGHGLLIIIAAIYAVKKRILNHNLGFVMQCSAISSIIFGFLYGSIFGQENIIPALWISPMRDTNKLIAVTIAIGVAMISLGILLNMIKQYRTKNFGEMLFNGQGAAGLALYWSLTTLAMIYITGSKIANTTVNMLWTVTIVMILLMIFKGALAKILLRENHKEGFVMIFFEIIENLLGFLSNTASFVRLAAFALNHVGLSMAVIMLSEMVHKLPGGIIMKWLILFLGNIVIVGLEGLIVFIQTLRLEYYEFFGKFYKGGGTKFTPVKWKEQE